MNKTSVKAGVFYGKEDIRIESIQLDPIESKGLRIKVLACGICGSDIRYYFNGPSPRYKIPGILGHEVCGEVVEVGSENKHFSPGMHVVLAPVIPCLNCDSCSTGLDNLCKEGNGFGYSVDGAFTEYMNISGQAVSAGVVVQVQKEIEPNAAALTELIGCCINGLEQIDLRYGQSVLIIGDGPIGLTFLQLARYLGANYVVTTGRRNKRRELALQLGADQALDVRNQSMVDMLAGIAFDHVVLATSNKEVLSQAISVAKPGGSLLVFSGYKGDADAIFDLNTIHYKQLKILGSIDCTIRQFHLAARLLPHLQMQKLVTSTFVLDELQKAFYQSKGEEEVKVVINPFYKVNKN